MLEFAVKNQHLTLITPNAVIVADSQDYLKARFKFTSDWDETVKIALFSRGETNVRAMLDENNIVTVPYQVLAGEGKFDISVFGNNRENADNLVITSSVITLKIKKSGLKNGETFDESVAGLEGGVLYEITGKVTEAQEKVDKAQAWAESDEAVEEGKYSAKHYAEAAAQSATNAGQSETNAADSKDAAARSAQAAAQSAQTAQSAAATAASDAATAAASQAAEQTSASITQTFQALLNAPYFGYDENGHLNFYYNREV